MGFKVGDIIKGKANGFEGIKKAKVLYVFGKQMKIRIKEHEYKSKQEKTYIVCNSMEDFELVEAKKFTKYDLQDGDLITYRNGDKAIKIKGKLRDLVGKTEGLLYISDITEELKYYIGSTNEQLDIIKVERPVKYEIVYERTEEEILNRNEKKYLKAVIKPFRDTIKYIVKIDNDESEEYESLEIDFKGNDDYMSFPNFKKGTMYKGMELCKKYTLEELGL